MFLMELPEKWRAEHLIRSSKPSRHLSKMSHDRYEYSLYSTWIRMISDPIDRTSTVWPGLQEIFQSLRDWTSESETTHSVTTLSTTEFTLWQPWQLQSPAWPVLPAPTNSSSKGKSIVYYHNHTYALWLLKIGAQPNSMRASRSHDSRPSLIGTWRKSQGLHVTCRWQLNHMKTTHTKKRRSSCKKNPKVKLAWVWPAPPPYSQSVHPRYRWWAEAQWLIPLHYYFGIWNKIIWEDTIEVANNTYFNRQ